MLSLTLTLAAERNFARINLNAVVHVRTQSDLPMKEPEAIRLRASLENPYIQDAAGGINFSAPGTL